MLTIEEKFLSHYFELRRTHDQVSIREVANLAVILRQFLKDGFLHKINRPEGRRKKILFPVDLNQDRVSRSRFFLAGYLLAIEPIQGETRVDLKNFDDFLAFKILRVEDIQFSISDLIDIVSNKMGNAHYNPDQAIALGLDPFDSRTNRAIKNSILRICKSVAKACEGLAQVVLPIDYNNSLGHWDADEVWAGNAHLIHEGNQWMEVNLSTTQESKGLSIFLAGTLMPINVENCVIVSIELKDNNRIHLGYNWKGDLFVEFCFVDGDRRLMFNTSEAWGTIGGICVYSLQLEALEECISGSLSVLSKGRKVFDENFGDPAGNFVFDAERMVFGADHLGQNGARMKLNELALFGRHDGRDIEGFRRYMLAKYELA